MKEKQLFSIGEVADMKGMTVKALRFYEEIGLLRPHRIDPFTKYRYYHRDQFLVIEIIKAARGMDVSPNDMVPFVEKKDTAGLLEFLQVHRETTEKRIHDLQELLLRMDNVTSKLFHAQSVADDEGIYLRTLAPRHILIKKVGSAKELQDSERIISDLELQADKRRLAGTYESGVLFEQADKDAPFAMTKLFTTVVHPFEGDDYQCLPGGLFACILVNSKNAVKQSEKMQKYLLDNNYDVSLITQIELLKDLFGKENPVEMQWKIDKNLA